MKNRFAHFLSGEFCQRYLVYRTTGYRTTWKLRLLVVALLAVSAMATRGWWVPAVGWSLVSDSGYETPDLILIDNLDSNYLLFEKAAELKRRGIGGLVLIPISAPGQDSEFPGVVAREIAEAMIREAGLDSVKLLPVKVIEPITLNTARQVAEFVKGTKDKRVLILTSGFKSKRIHLVFSKVLREVGIEVYCLPVWGSSRIETWVTSWHGIQEVFLQHVKLAYYRLWVL